MVNSFEASYNCALSEMARNEEKALTLFSKWSTFKTDYHSGKACAKELIVTVDYLITIFRHEAFI